MTRRAGWAEEGRASKLARGTPRRGGGAADAYERRKGREVRSDVDDISRPLFAIARAPPPTDRPTDRPRRQRDYRAFVVTRCYTREVCVNPEAGEEGRGLPDGHYLDGFSGGGEDTEDFHDEEKRELGEEWSLDLED